METHLCGIDSCREPRASILGIKGYGHRRRCSLIQGCIYDMFSKNMCKYPIRLEKLAHVININRFRRSREVGRLAVLDTPYNLGFNHAQDMFLFMRLCNVIEGR